MSFFEVKREHGKSDKAPDALIQKGRMHRHGRVHRNPLCGKRCLHTSQVSLGAFTVHSPGQCGVGTERLLIDEVAPAANPLPNQEADAHEVKERQNGNLAELCHQAAEHKRADDCTIDSDSALADINHIPK